MRSRLVSAACAALLLVPVSCTPTDTKDGAGPENDAAPPPNVLVIVTDDQWAPDTMRVMPRTRRLFEDAGVDFSNAYATTPQCCPSRASILTGQYSHNHGVKENKDGDLLDQRTTIPAYLRQRGYLTAIAGKFLQGIPIRVDPRPFDRWVTTGWGYYGRQFNVNGRMRTVDRYTTDFLGAAAVRFLRSFERRDRRPWFIYVAPTAPHLPYTPERRYRHAGVPSMRSTPALSERDRSDKPDYVRRERLPLEIGGRIYRDQLRTLISVDEMVGRLFRVMRKLDEEQRTLAIYSSDNGHLHGEHGLFGKRVPYLKSVHIPLLIRWPGRVDGGTVDDRLAANLDLSPTIMDALGYRPDGYAPDGHSLLEADRRELLMLEQFKNGNIPDWRSLITPTAQYTEYLDDRHRGVEFAEYYDLSSSRWQVDNMLPDGDPSALPEARALSKKLEEYARCAGTCP
ncbi:MAG: sulfatase-like hydrolase/transferase [Actinomycetota bacterium]